MLWHKYTILEGTILTDFLTSNRNGSSGTQILMVNRIVRVALHLSIHSQQIVVLFQLLLTRSVVLSLRQYQRGFVFFTLDIRFILFSLA